ncbi:hypothetical protein Nmel_012803 [Mimus melanotis]
MSGEGTTRSVNPSVSTAGVPCQGGSANGVDVFKLNFLEKKRRRLEELLADGMAVDGGCGDSGDWEGRWNHVKKFLERSGPFTHPDFEPGTQALDFLLSTCKVLVIGAGGLGCELLKNLALSGFRQIHVIDMDTIDVSNLNRQFLFRPKDVGRPKAEVAAEFLNSRIPNCAVVPLANRKQQTYLLIYSFTGLAFRYFKKIQDMDESFYRQFHIIVCGLDSIIARRWINGMLVNFPMCTIASMPRLPEHCIEYVRILQWPKEQPFGEGIALDGDDPEHIQWIYQKSLERASQFNIKGVTYRLTQGVVKRIIPAVASTNAVIAAVCATEVFKIATSAYVPLNNYLVFNDVDGLYTYSFEAERKENCPACSQLPQNIEISPSAKLQEILDYLTNNASLQMKSPAITATMYGGNKTLYLQTVASIEERTRPNLSKTLKGIMELSGVDFQVRERTNSLISGGWDTSSWGLSSNTEPQNQPVSPTAITKPVRRTVVDESENFFSAFLSPTDVQSIQKNPVVSKPPAKSQRPKEEVKSTLKESQHSSQLEGPVTTEAEVKDSSVAVVDLKSLDIPKEKLEDNAVLKSDAQHEASTKEVTDQKVSALNFEEPEDSPTEKSSVGGDGAAGAPEGASQPLGAGTKDLGLEGKERKTEDRQSNTPSPPISTFSSGTSTTSDIEVLDHESVISESSVSSRQEAADSKSSLHLMQTSFQLLSTSACADYNRLDDFQKMTESCGSSDAFERIDSFSVQSLDSRSVSEINSDDELSGRASASASVAVSPSVPKTETVDALKNKPENLNDAPVLHAEEAEMEESGRSATPVNSEQPDVVLVAAVQTVEEQVVKEEAEPQQDAGEQLMIDSLTEKLEKREVQLLSTSKERARLEEAYDNLKDEMFRMKEESSSLSSLKEEFAQRIADAEKKLQLACKERDAAKKEVKTIKEELATRLNTNETAELLKEKEEQIKGLMEEGEKLSKQQLHNSNIIKKLRAKEKERENTNTKQGKKIKELEEELQHLKQVLDGKEDLEKQHRDSIKQLNSVVERQEKDLAKLQAEVQELEERNRSVQAALDSAYKELADLHKANATKDSEAQEAALSREMKAKEELGLALEKAQEEARQQQEALAIQVADLRLALQRAEQQAARKEDYLRQEIGELQQRLQEAEGRNQELSQSVTSATRPLLRQIENLQATLGAQTSAWEKLEKNLSDRLGESQTLLAAAAERERAATEELLANKIQMSSSESQNSLLRQENTRLQAQLEVERNKLKKMENENSRYEVELEGLKDEYAKTLEDAKKEKALLATQLEMEKMKVEQERKKAILVQEAAKEKDRKSFTVETVSSTPSMSRSSSMSGVDMAGLQTSFLSQDDPHDHSLGPIATSGSNLYDAIRMGSGSSIIENLQSQLKLREGEISHLQLEIGNLEKTRSIMAEELVKLTNQNDELEEKVKEIPKLRTQLKDLDQRYNTILQMYGEKAEEAEELRLDLEDVKNMYKTQIDELLKQRQN